MSTLSSLKDTKTVLLTTYKRDGTPVDTAVSIAYRPGAESCGNLVTSADRRTE